VTPADTPLRGKRVLITGPTAGIGRHIALELKGVKRFIFGGVRIHSTIGAKYKGLRDFKMSFGSSLQKGYLWKYEYSSKKLYFYNLAVRLKTRLKNQKYLPDLVDQINI
jgi:hypothetical protein